MVKKEGIENKPDTVKERAIGEPQPDPIGPRKVRPCDLDLMESHVCPDHYGDERPPREVRAIQPSEGAFGFRIGTNTKRKDQQPQRKCQSDRRARQRNQQVLPRAFSKGGHESKHETGPADEQQKKPIFSIHSAFLLG
jgi:hypothetical protein